MAALYPSVSGELVVHYYYALDYNEAHEQANWVIYMADHFGNAERSDNFKEDPIVSTKSASLADYKSSGYDRGHIAPAADMSISELAMTESFYLSNMSPQVPAFNRGIWKNLEAKVRDWAVAAQSPSDIVITGPILDGDCGKIGNGVSVPCAYFKIYVDLQSEKAIAFILPNESSKKEIKEFVVSIDSIEYRTNIDFFHTFSESKQSDIESQKNPNDWQWD
ncbi:MAG: endonuclease G [Marinoscillum sp.]